MQLREENSKLLEEQKKLQDQVVEHSTARRVAEFQILVSEDRVQSVSGLLLLAPTAHGVLQVGAVKAILPIIDAG